MSIPHCFDPLISAKPKHPQVGLLSQVQEPVDEVAPPSQIPGLNLTQFNNIGTFRPNPHQHILKCSTRACRAKNLQNWVVWFKILKYKQAGSLTPRHELSSVIPSSPNSAQRCDNTSSHVPGFIEQVSADPHIDTDHWSINLFARCVY